jgi:hypothetical protein
VDSLVVREALEKSGARGFLSGGKSGKIPTDFAVKMDFGNRN